MVNIVHHSAQIAVALIFLVSAFSKARTATAYKSFNRSLQQMDLVPKRLAGATAALVVCVEAVIPVMISLPQSTRAGFMVAAIVMLVFIMVILRTLRQGKASACPCFGPKVTTLGRRHAVRNLLVIGVALTGWLTVRQGSYPGDEVAEFAVAALGGSAAAAVVISFDDLVSLFVPSVSNERRSRW